QASPTHDRPTATTPSRGTSQPHERVTTMTVATGPSRTHQAPTSAVVVNPSKVDNLKELRGTVDDTLSRAGWPAPQWFETTPHDPGLGQTRAAVQSGAEGVFVCGGDGPGMSGGAPLVGPHPAMAILPAGTGNLLAANLGLSTDLATGLEV